MILFSYTKIFLDAVWKITVGGGRPEEQERDWSEAVKFIQPEVTVAWSRVVATEMERSGWQVR